MKDGQAPDAVEHERLKEFLRWRLASRRRRPASGRRVLFFGIGATAGVLTGLLIMIVARAVLGGPARLVSAPIQRSAEGLDQTLRRVLPSVETTRPGMEATQPIPAEEPERLRSAEAPPPAIAHDERRTAASHWVERRTRPAREPVADLARAAEVGARASLTAPAEPATPRAAATGAVASSPASPSRTAITPAMPGAPTRDTPDSATIADRSRPIPTPLDPGSAGRDTIDHAEAGAVASTNATSAMPATLAADVPRDVAADSPPSPPVTASLDPVVSGSEASGARGQRSRTMETMTRLIGYIPEVRVGRAIFRWAKSQPPVDRETPPSSYEAPQAR
jgi:hypothetical protein